MLKGLEGKAFKEQLRSLGLLRLEKSGGDLMAASSGGEEEGAGTDLFPW